MRFQPIPESELKQKTALKEGDADFEVLDAQDTTSKSTNKPMIKLTLKVWDCEGKTGTLFDYLINDVQWKVHNFLESIGKKDLYESGDIYPGFLIGKTGKAKLKLESDKSGNYGNQIKVKEYIAAKQKEEIKYPEGLAEDDINF